MVVYELHKEPNSDDYKEIVKIIKEYDFMKIGGSEYCIYTDDSPGIVSGKIKPYIEDNERLRIPNKVG